MIYVIIIKHAKFLQFGRVSTTTLRTSLQLQIPCTWSLPTPHIYSTFPIGGAFRMQSRSFFAETVDVFRPLAIFAEQLHRGCLTGFQMRFCPIIHYSSLACRSSEEKFPPLGLHQGILDPPCLLILLIYTKHKNKR